MKSVTGEVLAFIARMYDARWSWTLDITGLTAIFAGVGLLSVFVIILSPHGSAPQTAALWVGGAFFLAAVAESLLATSSRASRR